MKITTAKIEKQKKEALDIIPESPEYCVQYSVREEFPWMIAKGELETPVAFGDSRRSLDDLVSAVLTEEQCRILNAAIAYVGEPDGSANLHGLYEELRSAVDQE